MFRAKKIALAVAMAAAGVSRPQKSLTLTGLLGLIWSRALNQIPVNYLAPAVSLVVR